MDLNSSGWGAGGSSATVGIKDSAWEDSFLQLCYDSGPNEFVGTGMSTRISRGSQAPHAVTVGPGEVVSNVNFGNRNVWLTLERFRLTPDSGWDQTDCVTAEAQPMLVFTFSRPAFGDGQDLRVLDPNSQPVAVDQVIGWGAEMVVASLSGPLEVEGRYSVILDAAGGIEDQAGNPLNNGRDEVVSFVLDKTPPSILSASVNGGEPQRSCLYTLDVAFAEDVSAGLVAGQWSLVDHATGRAVDLNDAAVSYEPATQIATWRLSGPGLEGGHYAATLLCDGVTDRAGNAMTGQYSVDFHILPGDTTGDGVVNDDDLSLLLANWGQAAGLDITGDGTVSDEDLSLLLANWDRRLSPPVGEKQRQDPPQSQADLIPAQEASASRAAAQLAGHILLTAAPEAALSAAARLDRSTAAGPDAPDGPNGPTTLQPQPREVDDDLFYLAAISRINMPLSRA